LGVAVIWLPQVLRFEALEPAMDLVDGLAGHRGALRRLCAALSVVRAGPVRHRGGARHGGRGGWDRLARWQAPRAGRWLALPGRHSLAVYLIHQPVLIALIWLATHRG
jgi:peptidoglycan/LPS O-acetylase OafA/YrhL